MKRFMEAHDRSQSTLFPERREDFVGVDNPVRVIDVFVDELDLGELGFNRVAPEVTGRPGYHPAALETDALAVVADRGYFKSEEILACAEAGITVTPPQPQTSGSKAPDPNRASLLSPTFAMWPTTMSIFVPPLEQSVSGD